MKPKSSSMCQRGHGWRRAAGATAVLATLAVDPAVLGQSADALIDKLVEKGVLTVKEANDLREEADEDFTKAYSVKSGLSDWVTALKLNGDFRGRFEGFYSDNPYFVDRNRFRYRVRLGVTASIKDNIEVGVRLGSGDIDNASSLVSGVDPISNNQTLQNNGSKKGVFLDLAYAKWTPLHQGDWSGSLTLGKMENPFVFSDLVFDGDYTPEGAAQQVAYTINSRHTLKLNLGEFILDEIGSDSDDPYLMGGQLRLESVWSPKVSTSLGTSFLTILGEQSLASSAVPDMNAGNRRNTRVTTNADGSKSVSLLDPVSGYDTLVVDASATYTLEGAPMYRGAFPVKVFGEYLHNGAAEDQNQGWQAGAMFGKAGKRGTWELTYRYKRLEGDVWYEELTDSDSGAYYQNSPSATLASARQPKSGYWAGTNIRGHVVRAGYSPFDSMTLQVTLFDMELIEEYPALSDSRMTRLQVDAIWKF